VEGRVGTLKASSTIGRGVSLLKHLADGANGVTDLSKAVRLSKSTAHRLLKSLEASHLVIQDPITHRYFLGPLVFELASRSLAAHQTLLLCAVEDMTYLRNLSGETVALYMRVGRDRVCLEEVESGESIKFTAGKGCVFPLHVGSSGKVLLAELEDDSLNLLLRNERWASVGPNTITNKAIFLRELKQTRKQGYATSFSERVAGGASLSVPIKNYVCPIAMSVLGPDNRWTVAAMMRLLDNIKAAAARISKRLTAATRGVATK
jgi:DNA-binding IclR family transcriptional regulator